MNLPRILGLATAAPDNRVPQAALAEAAAACCSPRVARLLPRLYARSGVATRGCAVFPTPAGLAANPSADPSADRCPHDAWVAAIRGVFPPATKECPDGPGVAERMKLYRAAALPLAAAAAGRALAEAGLNPSGIDQLVTVSCTGFAAPGVDLALMTELGLPPETARTHVGFMGCHGAMNGLRVAGALAAAKPGRRVLLVCVEVCTAHFRYGDKGLTANALFADGAAAAVISSDEGGGGPTLVDHASLVLPDSGDAMTWDIGANGFEMTLSPAVPGLIADQLPGVAGPWLARHGLRPADIAGWAIHPGGPRVISAVGEALGLPASALAPSHALLREHGNMSSPTVLFLLERLQQNPTKRPLRPPRLRPGAHR